MAPSSLRPVLRTAYCIPHLAHQRGRVISRAQHPPVWWGGSTSGYKLSVPPVPYCQFFQTTLFSPSSPFHFAVTRDWQWRCVVCLAPQLQAHVLPSERHEMHLDARAVTIHPLAEVNFYDQIIVHPQGLAE